MTDKNGLVVVVSAPSGAGKSTICNKIIKNLKKAAYSVSATTRKPRKGEIDGKDYFFLSEQQFKKLIKSNKLLEWAHVHGHYYGTPREFIEKQLSEGRIIILDIDVRGAMQLKKAELPRAIFIFIKTPTFSELKKRLIQRGLDAKKTIDLRLKNAKNELKFAKNYDYVIINDKLPKAIKETQAVILKEYRKK